MLSTAMAFAPFIILGRVAAAKESKADTPVAE
jgi:hypothetical protein